MPMDRSLYPENWDELARQIKTEANWCCTECGRLCRPPGESFDAFLKRCWGSKPGDANPTPAMGWTVVSGAAGLRSLFLLSNQPKAALSRLDSAAF